MRAHRLLLLLALALPLNLGAEPKLALFGSFPADKSAETDAAHMAVDAYNNGTLGAAVKGAVPAQGGPRLRLAVFNTGLPGADPLDTARRVADDRDVLAVVVYGEAGVAPEVLAVFKQAHLAVVAATSWAQPRNSDSGTTWLCPGLGDLAETAALYVRREADTEQFRRKKEPPKAAVVDDGSPTSTAAAKAFAARYRSLGGKVLVETSWSGGEEDLTSTIKVLDAQWPQLVFYTGGAESAGRLVVAMKDEKALKDAFMIGLPPLFDPLFFSSARKKGKSKALFTRALFPCTDYDGLRNLAQTLGFAFQMTSPEFKTYYQFANRHPGRWTSMLFDGVALAARAVRLASMGGADAAAGAATDLSRPAQTARMAPLAGGALPPSARDLSYPAAAAALTDTAVNAVDPTPTAQAAELPNAPPLTRDTVRAALTGIDSYRGIRGVVKFSATREPQEPRAMVYFALSHVGRKEMYWKQRAYGPPFGQTNH
jgi:ABC-type branched-subunit amino acid transport system substrate-binding protein